MQLASGRLFLLLFHLLTSAGLQELDEVAVEVITDSSPCSVTCGVGIKTQTLCLLKEGETTAEENVMGEDETKVPVPCRVRKVKCLESWQCGLRTMTVTAGQKAELDCLGEVMEAMGRFSWRVSWRYARGIISSDDSLFARWKVPQLDRVALDPVKEEDAGTYRCDVQDPTFRKVKRIYWGIRVLPVGIVNLDYESSLAHWDLTGNQQQDQTHWPYLRMLLVCATVTILICGTALLFFWTAEYRNRGTLTNDPSEG